MMIMDDTKYLGLKTYRASYTDHRHEIRPDGNQLRLQGKDTSIALVHTRSTMRPCDFLDYFHMVLNICHR